MYLCLIKLKASDLQKTILRELEDKPDCKKIFAKDTSNEVMLSKINKGLYFFF